MSNVKPGDLAIVVRAKVDKHMNGVIIRVVARCEHWPDCWTSDPVFYNEENRPRSFRDSILKRINDPGEDAQDETLLWLDVPSAEKVDA